MKQGTFKKVIWADHIAKQQIKKLEYYGRAKKAKNPRAKGNIRRWGTNLWTVHQADVRFSKWLRKKVGHCERCFTKEGLTCSHYIGRAEYVTRYLEENCDVLCGKCHSHFEGKKTTEYKLWKIAKMGQEAYDRLWAMKFSYISVAQSIYDCMKLVNK